MYDSVHVVWLACYVSAAIPALAGSGASPLHKHHQLHGNDDRENRQKSTLMRRTMRVGAVGESQSITLMPDGGVDLTGGTATQVRSDGQIESADMPTLPHRARSTLMRRTMRVGAVGESQSITRLVEGVADLTGGTSTRVRSDSRIENADMPALLRDGGQAILQKPYLGCFADNVNDRDLPIRKGSGKSNTECSQACASYKYFGLQWTKECWCGDSYGKHGSASGCDCNGNNIGGTKSCIYDNQANKQQTRTPHAGGCYKITDRRQCCKHTDGRANYWGGHDCVPAKGGLKFTSGNVCESKAWTDSRGGGATGTCTSAQYEFIGQGVAGPTEVWNVNTAKGLGVASCYNAVTANSRCNKDYFSYVTRGDKNCGCKGSSGALSLRKDKDVDYFKITSSPGPATTARPPPTQSAVERHGMLSVRGNKIIDKTGTPVRLRGMSLFWSQWMTKYWNADVVNWLKDDWHITVIRAPMAIEPDGYLEHPAREKGRLETVVYAAIAVGIYVVIDWHDHHADKHVHQAKGFFSEMARKYGGHPNVLFELFNEPEHQSWSGTIKPYHEQVVRVIRQHTKNIAILGTRHWSTEVDEASRNRVHGENLAYTVHFYANNHRQSVRNKVSKALANGVAIFASEWGTCDCCTGSGYNLAETHAWLKLLKQHHISDTNWAVSDLSNCGKYPTCCNEALKPGASSKGGWSSNSLNPSGRFIRASLRGEPTDVGTNPGQGTGERGGCCKFKGKCGDCGWHGNGWCHESASNCEECRGHFDYWAIGPQCGR